MGPRRNPLVFGDVRASTRGKYTFPIVICINLRQLYDLGNPLRSQLGIWQAYCLA
jgi:hypothetical protein